MPRTQRFALAIRTHLHHDLARVGLWYPVAFAVGIGIYCTLPFPYAEMATSAAMLAAIATRGFQKLAAMWLWLASGVLCCHMHAVVRGAELIKQRLYLDHQPAVITRITHHEKGNFLDIRTDHGCFHVWRRGHATSPPAGHSIIVSAFVFPPQARHATRDFDEKWAAFWQGNAATGHVTYLAPVYAAHDPPVRHHPMDTAISKFVHPELGQLWSKLIRAEGVISKSTRQTYALSGLSHVLAVSGLHMTIVGGMIFVMMSRLLILLFPWRWHSYAHRVAALVCLPVLWLYAWQCWGAVSARRAVVLSSLVLISHIVNKPHHAMTLCLLAGLFVLLLNPEALFSLSFQMSFMAVFTLVHESSQRIMTPARNKTASSIISNLCTTVKLTLVTTLYATALPDVCAVGLGVISNLWTIPYVSYVVMPLAFLTYIATMIALPAEGVISLCEGALMGLNACACFGAWLSHAMAIPIPKPTPVCLALITLSLLWGMIWRGSWRRWNRIGLMIAVAAQAAPAPPYYDMTAIIQSHIAQQKRVTKTLFHTTFLKGERLT